MVRSWIRQALRASGVAILVPAAVAAAIALSVVGGGRDLGALGEVLKGPAAPPAETATPPTRPRGQSPQSPQSRSRVRGQSPQSRLSMRGQAPQSPQSRPRPAHPPEPHARTPEPRAPSAPAASSPSAPPPAVSKPHPIHVAGSQAADTLRPLPLAGPAAAGAVQAAVNLVDPA